MRDWGAWMQEEAARQGKANLPSPGHSCKLRVNPRLPVALGALWMRGCCFFPCIYLHGATSAQGTL